MNKLRPHLRIMFAWSPGGMVLALCLIIAWNMWLHPTDVPDELYFRSSRHSLLQRYFLELPPVPGQTGPG